MREDQKTSGRESRAEKRTRQKYKSIIRSEVIEWIQTGKQINTTAKLGQLHNALYRGPNDLISVQLHSFIALYPLPNGAILVKNKGICLSNNVAQLKIVPQTGT